ncbi:MAG: hypothetical protein KDA90_06970 [Planctomycetaceae bacterium]|nr:hypothetical protein [Planctomycetaceae bacterium]
MSPQRLAEILTLTVGGQTIQSTTEHPFFVQDKGWTEAQELQPGDLLLTSEGRWVAIESIQRDRQPAPVYNLTVDYWHTYFLGTPAWGFDVWVHNDHVKRGVSLNSGESLRRPYKRKAFREAVEDAAPRTADGMPIDPNLKTPIEGRPHFGHVYGEEHRRLVKEAEALGMNQKQFNDWINSHPEWFQLEDPIANMTHFFEKPGG